jgi:hypothetical protein
VPDIINAFLDSEPLSINIGSGAAVISQLALFQPAVISDFFDITEGTSFYYKEGFNLQVLLAYAQEIWQRTAARGEANHFVNSGAVTGSGTLSARANEFVAIQFTATSYPTNRRFLDGSPPIVDCGWVAFTYAGYQGPLQRINFENQVFFPETSNADGFSYWLWPGAAGSFYGTTKDYSGVPLPWSPGSFSNMGSQVTSGLHYDGPNVTVVAGSQTNNLTVPVQDGNLVLQTYTLANWLDVRDNITHTGDFALWTSLLAYLVEAWQSVATPQASIGVPTFHSFSGPHNNFNGDYPVMQTGQLIVQSSGGESDENFGPTGLKMFGYFAAIYGSFMGKLQFINNTSMLTIPEGPDATGWMINAKEDVHGQMQVFGTARRCQGIQTPYGDISLADGVHSGLLW